MGVEAPREVECLAPVNTAAVQPLAAWSKTALYP